MKKSAYSKESLGGFERLERVFQQFFWVYKLGNNVIYIENFRLWDIHGCRSSFSENSVLNMKFSEIVWTVYEIPGKCNVFFEIISDQEKVTIKKFLFLLDFLKFYLILKSLYLYLRLKINLEIWCRLKEVFRFLRISLCSSVNWRYYCVGKTQRKLRWWILLFSERRWWKITMKINVMAMKDIFCKNNSLFFAKLFLDNLEALKMCS